MKTVARRFADERIATLRQAQGKLRDAMKNCVSTERGNDDAPITNAGTKIKNTIVCRDRSRPAPTLKNTYFIDEPFY
jgi:hypothetical protein